jgi:hypothetical protein
LVFPGNTRQRIKNILYKSDFTFSPKISPYNAGVMVVWANEISPLQIPKGYKYFASSGSMGMTDKPTMTLRG